MRLAKFIFSLTIILCSTTQFSCKERKLKRSKRESCTGAFSNPENCRENSDESRVANSENQSTNTENGSSELKDGSFENFEKTPDPETNTVYSEIDKFISKNTKIDFENRRREQPQTLKIKPFIRKFPENRKLIHQNNGFNHEIKSLKNLKNLDPENKMLYPPKNGNSKGQPQNSEMQPKNVDFQYVNGNSHHGNLPMEINFQSEKMQPNFHISHPEKMHLETENINLHHENGNLLHGIFNLKPGKIDLLNDNFHHGNPELQHKISYTNYGNSEMQMRNKIPEVTLKIPDPNHDSPIDLNDEKIGLKHRNYNLKIGKDDLRPENFGLQPKTNNFYHGNNQEDGIKYFQPENTKMRHKNTEVQGQNLGNTNLQPKNIKLQPENIKLQLDKINSQLGSIHSQNGNLEPGNLQSGNLQSGSLQLGNLQPGSLQLGNLQPGSLQLGNSQPGSLQLGNSQPGSLQLGNLQPESLQPGNLQSGNLHPGNLQPGNLHLGNSEPGNLQLGNLQPGNSNPGNFEPGNLQPGNFEPGNLHPGNFVPGNLQPRNLQPGNFEPGNLHPGNFEPGNLQPGNLQPEIENLQPGVFYKHSYDLNVQPRNCKSGNSNMQPEDLNLQPETRELGNSNFPPGLSNLQQENIDSQNPSGLKPEIILMLQNNGSKLGCLPWKADGMGFKNCTNFENLKISPEDFEEYPGKVEITPEKIILNISANVNDENSNDTTIMGIPLVTDGLDPTLNQFDFKIFRFRRANSTWEFFLDPEKINKYYICTQGMNRGKCREHIPRWTYNPAEKACVEFSYGGCNGNANNFEKEQDCLAMCNGI